jgi:GNAT superfamily N-acetyltransferase
LSKPVITVRLIAHNELPQLLALYQHLNPVDAPLPVQEVLQSMWDKILDAPRLYYIVAIVPNFTRGARPYAIIENVVTHPDYRRQGLGTRVLHYALDLAWQQQCYKVMLLTSSKSEETLHFYKRAGFKSGVKTGFIARPPEKL